MSQHDYNITPADANTGVEYRAAVNAALQALASSSSGPTAPVTTYANQLWADRTTGWLKLRNIENTSWNYVTPLFPSLRQIYVGVAYNDVIPLGVDFILVESESQSGTWAELPSIYDFLQRSVVSEIVIKRIDTTGSDVFFLRIASGTTDTIEGNTTLEIAHNSTVRLRAGSIGSVLKWYIV